MSHFQDTVKATKTVRDLVPIHEHPPAPAVKGIFRVATAQMRELKEKFKDSNDKAKFIRYNLTPEQLYIYEWIAYVYTIMALPLDVFARQLGCTARTVNMWLKRRGHFPQSRFFHRLLSIYKTNFCDQLAVELLHGDMIGKWREKYRPIWEQKEIKGENNG